MILNQEDTVLLVIDIQEKLINATFNKEMIETKSKILANVANILKIPTILTEQYPKGLGNTIRAIKSSLDDFEVFEKTDFNALADNKLSGYLDRLNCKQVMVIGIETHICVHQTVDALLKKGFEVAVIQDACGSRKDVEHNYALNYMKNSGAKIKTTEMAVFELLKTARHPDFKEIQGYIK